MTSSADYKDLFSSGSIARSNKELLTWVNGLVCGHIVQTAQLIHGGAVSLGDLVEGIAGLDFVVLSFGFCNRFLLSGVCGFGQCLAELG